MNRRERENKGEDINEMGSKVGWQVISLSTHYNVVSPSPGLVPTELLSI